MIATEELRDGLRAHGAEVRYPDERTTYWYGELDGSEWGTWTAVEHDGLLHVSFSDEGDFLTPQEAIAVTVGAGTCKVETIENWLPAERYHRCKHCGAFFAVLDASGDIPLRVCPNCGKTVEE